MYFIPNDIFLYTTITHNRHWRHNSHYTIEVVFDYLLCRRDAKHFLRFSSINCNHQFITIYENQNSYCQFLRFQDYTKNIQKIFNHISIADQTNGLALTTERLPTVFNIFVQYSCTKIACGRN